MIRFPESRDIATQLAGVSKMSFGLGYDFTQGLGLRDVYSGNVFNPISWMPFLFDSREALGLIFVSAIPLLYLSLAALSRRLAESSSVASFGTLAMALLVLVPSSLRVENTEYGGSGFALAYIFAPLTWSILGGLRDAAAWKLERRDIAIQGFFFFGMSAAGLGQPVFVWIVAILTICESLLTVASSGVRRAAQILARVLAHGVVASLASAILFGSPILAVLSSANARDGTSRGVSERFEPLLVWYQFGTSFVMRALVLLVVVVSLLALWRSGQPGKRDFAKSILLVAGLITGYSWLFTSLIRRSIEIGPRPEYLASWIVTPAVAFLFCLLLEGLIGRSLSMYRAGRFSYRHNAVSLVVSLLLPVIALVAFAVKNPSLALAGVRLSQKIELPDFMSSDPLLEGIDSGRVMVVDPGVSLLGKGLQPSEVFTATFHRRHSTSIVFLAAHSHSVTRWQSLLTDGSPRGRLLAIYFFSTEFDMNLARRFGATHVVVGAPLNNDAARLVRLSTSASGVVRYLYRLSTPTPLPPGTTVNVSRESDIDLATEQALRSDLENPEIMFVDRMPRELVVPLRADYRVEADRITLNLESPGESALVLPIEFSACHFASRHVHQGAGVELMPLNGRFLGVVFSGTFKGEIRFREFGPLGLACQFEDFTQTRHVG